MVDASEEFAKLKVHHSLLRDEYEKLQAAYLLLQHQHELLSAQSNQDSFPGRLLKVVSNLYKDSKYSDIQIILGDGELPGHRFVFGARSTMWMKKDIEELTELDLTDFDIDVASALVQWVYRGEFDERSSDEADFHTKLLKAASQFHLKPLALRCEGKLVSSIVFSNCISFYHIASEVDSKKLLQHSTKFIAANWKNFVSEDFASLPAALCYHLFKSQSLFPLHVAVKMRRQDVVLLFLLEYAALLPEKCDELDNEGHLALNLALESKQISVANQLLERQANLNKKDGSGSAPLHLAVERRDESSALFLINRDCDLNLCTGDMRWTALHMVCSFDPGTCSQETMTGMASVGVLLIRKHADINLQDARNRSALHLAILSDNPVMFSALLEDRSTKLDLQDAEGHVPLWLALSCRDQRTDAASAAHRLIKRGASVNAVNDKSGCSLLHLAARQSLEEAAIFLIQNGATVDVLNHEKETTLHIASTLHLSKLAQVLLENGANPNIQLPSGMTALHLAIQHRAPEIFEIILQHKKSVKLSENPSQIIPNINLRDQNDETPVSLALWSDQSALVEQLVTAGVSLNQLNQRGRSLLHLALDKQDNNSAVFLMQHSADCNVKTRDGESCLDLAIRNGQQIAAELLCQRGADMHSANSTGEVPLWLALASGRLDIALVLIRHGCDPDQWHSGPDKCQQTLLHKAIDENMEDAACFLIQNRCLVNVTRRPGPNDEGGFEARDGQMALHMCAQWGLDRTIQCLLEHGADINAQDSEGKTALHYAVDGQHVQSQSLLISHPQVMLAICDKSGMTPFAVAMATRNNKAAQAILSREPAAAEQFDSRGRNFLHIAVQKCDIESVYCLISVQVDVNSRVRDSSKLTPLHIAVQAGSEIIVRNLILAGANVNDVTPEGRTALHLASERNLATISSILIENGIAFDGVDQHWNNALHVAVQHGHLEVSRTLLTECRINAEAVNMKEQNPLHLTALYSQNDSIAIFELFMECMPHYPIDRPDMTGSTPLLLAYLNGYGALCRAIVRAGAQLGVKNNDGLSIFNAPVATKQLLHKLLDLLSTEPAWFEGEFCLECNAKFSIKTRKHHCRHCGRLLCSKCSNKDVPILKYNLPKPVRVCDICFEVLSLGSNA